MIFHCLHTETLICAAESSTKLTVEKEVSGAITKRIPSDEIQSPWEQLLYGCGRGKERQAHKKWKYQTPSLHPPVQSLDHVCAENEHRTNWGLKGQEDPGCVPLPSNQNPSSPHSHRGVSAYCLFCRGGLSRGRPCS